MREQLTTLEGCYLAIPHKIKHYKSFYTLHQTHFPSSFPEEASTLRLILSLPLGLEIRNTGGGDRKAFVLSCDFSLVLKSFKLRTFSF